MGIGIWKLVLIVLVILIVFGAGKLPRVMGDIGKGIRSLKDGLKEDDVPPAQMKDVSPTAARESTGQKEV
jgi:sec-independent protein translocase protein TatA